MIATEDLIRSLAADVKPLRRGAAQLRLAAGIGAGAAVALVVLWLSWRAPLSAVAYTGVPTFTMKLAYAATMAAATAILLLAAGRPGQRIGMRLLWLIVPPVLVAANAIMELAMTAPQFREAEWLGSTWQICILSTAGLSLPILAGIVWAFRRMAPTNLRLAGLLAGLASGSAAAVVYALFCPETTAAFLATWYTLGIAVAGLIGLLAGPRLLRW
ncbi:MAG: DUF1109 domain-containing protein [Sphingomonas sp.]|nr:DUF1109 domain-containing protein [Sphingomonas sp.]